MTAQATNTSYAATPFGARVKASLQRGWTRFVIGRQMEGIRVAAQHLGNTPQLKARMVALREEMARV